MDLLGCVSDSNVRGTEPRPVWARLMLEENEFKEAMSILSGTNVLRIVKNDRSDVKQLNRF
jgi:hypothetical protein